MQIKIYNSIERITEINALVTKGYVKGYRMPFRCLDNLYSLKLGATTYFVGHEYSGKTEFVLERDIWLSKQFGLVHCIFTPETGRSEEIYLELCHKWTGRYWYGKTAMTDKERLQALKELSPYFHIIESEGEISMDEIFKAMDDHEVRTHIKFNTLTIDPFNELKWDLGGLPRDMWLEATLGKVRRRARDKNIHITIVTHPIESDRLYDQKEGYWLPPTRKQYAGGQAWPRKGESMAAIWRPPYSDTDPTKYRDEDGIPYEHNEMHFIMQKSKPKGTGSIGLGVLYFDREQSRYYELYGADKLYAGEFYQKYEAPKQSLNENQKHEQGTIF